MFAILDTNHLRKLVSRTSAAGRRLRERIPAEKAAVFACIVTVEEDVRGWLALLQRHTAGPAQVETYARMQESLEIVVKLGMLPFDDDAAQIYSGLRRAFRRGGTMDLKIAAICLAHDATLLTRNDEDFTCLPGLRVENWLD
ncbi:MAG: type II toxin-antitoxin system VapC family toxin [Prosthecobacter sp.]|uniref:type II toxin-antitoxin system VapC family toxin n=1 Tax=Prosthecobacter sp. TaxID=1965333 RepID=UPI003903E89C